MTTATERDRFPMRNEVLQPVKEFKINGRWVSLYWNKNAVPPAYTMYWNDTGENIQHLMSDMEVFSVLAGLLNPEDE